VLFNKKKLDVSLSAMAKVPADNTSSFIIVLAFVVEPLLVFVSDAVIHFLLTILWQF